MNSEWEGLTTEVRVVSVTPVDEPQINDARPPVVQRVRIEARGGTAGCAVLTWVETCGSNPRVGDLLVIRLRPVE